MLAQPTTNHDTDATPNANRPQRNPSRKRRRNRSPAPAQSTKKINGTTMLRLLFPLAALLLAASVLSESISNSDIGNNSKIKHPSFLRGGAHHHNRQLNKEKHKKKATTTPPPAVDDDDDDFAANIVKEAEVLIEEEEESSSSSSTAATTTTAAATTTKHDTKEKHKKDKEKTTTTTATAAASTTTTSIEKEHDEENEKIAQEAQHTSKAKKEQETPTTPTNNATAIPEDELIQQLEELDDELTALDQNNTNGINNEEMEELEEEEFVLIEEIMEEEGRLDDEFEMVDDDAVKDYEGGGVNGDNADEESEKDSIDDDTAIKELLLAEQIGEINDTIEEIESETDDGDVNVASMKEDYIEGLKQGEDQLVGEIVKEAAGNSTAIESKIEEMEEMEKILENEDDDGAFEEGKKEAEEGIEVIEQACKCSLRVACFVPCFDVVGNFINHSC